MKPLIELTTIPMCFPTEGAEKSLAVVGHPEPSLSGINNHFKQQWRELEKEVAALEKEAKHLRMLNESLGKERDLRGWEVSKTTVSQGWFYPDKVVLNFKCGRCGNVYSEDEPSQEALRLAGSFKTKCPACQMAVEYPVRRG